MIDLVPADGYVVSPLDFAARFSTNLSGVERIFLEQNASLFGTEAEIPPTLRTPWIAASGSAGENADRIVARPSGVRSAVWDAEQIQFKGCRRRLRPQTSLSSTWSSEATGLSRRASRSES